MLVRHLNRLLLAGLLFASVCGAAQKPTSLRDALKKVTKTFGTQFVFDKQLLDGKATMYNLDHIAGKPLEEVLKAVLYPNDLLFLYINTNYYSIVPKDRIRKESTVENKLPPPVTMTPETGTPESLRITGVVTDSSGKGIADATVTDKGSGNSTRSNTDGSFVLYANNPKTVLSVSSIGYETTEAPLGGKTSISVSLAIKAVSMGEVVVIGYGTQSKRNVTGAISKVNMRQLEDLPNTNVSQALRGRVAGVQFIDNGRPGQGGSILIRGTRSLNGGNNPLIVLDGIQFNGSLSDINPNDIESMEILKDASAAAIYGSRAANGVILITSKRGKSDKPTIRANAYQGISGWSYKMKLLSPDRYRQALLDWRKQSGLPGDPSQIDQYLQPSEAEAFRAGKTVDALDAIAQRGKISAYDISLSGRSAATNYFLSASLTDEKGLIFNDNQKRISLRANIENKVNTWLTLGLNTTYIRRDLSGREADLLNAYWTSPYGKLYYDDGAPTRFPVPEEQLVVNPLRNALLTKNEEIYNNLFTNFYTLVSVPHIPGLTYRFNYSPNYRWRHHYNFVRQDRYLNSNTTSASKFNQQEFDWVLENIVTYKKRLRKDHAFDVTLLYGKNHTEYESTTANAAPLSNPTLGWNSLGLGEVQTVQSDAAQTNGVSSMFRLNYQLRSKYIFTFTVRRDGSSVFAENNKYANFPSAAVAWIVSDEKFLTGADFINSLKLRASYGSVGNQAIGPYQSLSLSGVTQYVFGDGGMPSTGVFPISIANPNLKWETTVTGNLALDFDLFKSRLSGTVEVYSMNTKDLIVRRTLPIMTGYTSILTNLGATNNKGLEVSLNSINIRSKRIEWTANLTFSTNKNKIVHLYNSDTNGDGREDDDLSNRWFIGKPVFVAYDYVQDGIYQEGDVLPTGYKPGFVRLKDLNGDKKIDASDRQIIGQLEPKHRWGFGNNFRYSNLTLSVFVNAMTGWIRSFNHLDFTGSALGNNYPGRAVNMIDAGWWTAENRSATRPSLVYTNPFLHGYYLSRNFVRLQDVSLAYEFSKPFLEKAGLKSLRVYISGKNLYTMTDWIGPDPESGYNTQADYFPTPRSFVAGLNVSF